MTPDELPAIEGRVEAFIRWTDPRNTKPFSGSSLQLVSDLRALLKAYQEQRRALERLANKDNEFGSEVQTIARAALTGEDTATLGLSGKTQTDARTRGDG
jgi:beta-lactamase class D